MMPVNCSFLFLLVFLFGSSQSLPKITSNGDSILQQRVYSDRNFSTCAKLNEWFYFDINVTYMKAELVIKEVVNINIKTNRQRICKHDIGTSKLGVHCFCICYCCYQRTFGIPLLKAHCSSNS